MSSDQGSSSQLQRRGSFQKAASVTTDATRRMVCGGLAGMIAKVCVDVSRLFGRGTWRLYRGPLSTANGDSARCVSCHRALKTHTCILTILRFSLSFLHLGNVWLCPVPTNNLHINPLSTTALLFFQCHRLRPILWNGSKCYLKQENMLGIIP